VADKALSGTCRSRLLLVALASGDQPEARRLAKEVLSVDPNSPEAQIVDALQKVDSNDMQSAESEIQNAVLHQPGNFQAHYLLARIHMINGSPEQARQELEKAIKARPGFLSAKLALAELQFALGEYDRARKLGGELLLTTGSCSRVRNIVEASERANETEETVPQDVVRGSVLKLGKVQADLAGDYLATSSNSGKRSSISHSGSTGGNSGECLMDLRSGSDPTGVYLRDSLVDEAIEAFSALNNRNFDPWSLAFPVPGRWM
jgi:tetratricopeptide (TPR) repeat protein